MTSGFVFFRLITEIADIAVCRAAVAANELTVNVAGRFGEQEYHQSCQQLGTAAASLRISCNCPCYSTVQIISILCPVDICQHEDGTDRVDGDTLVGKLGCQRDRKAVDGCLTRGVGRVLRLAMGRGEGTDIDDPADALLGHVGGSDFCANDSAADIDVHDCLPTVDIHFAQILHM